MSWPDTRDALGAFLSENGLTGIGAEVGVFLGKYSEQLLATWPGTLVLVDAWRHLPDYSDPWNFDDSRFEQLFDKVRARMCRFGERAQILRALSGEAALRFPDAHFDFVYIDGDHSYRGCRADLEIWWPKLKHGGLFCGHDYLHGVREGERVVELPEATVQSLATYGVKAAVDEFAAVHGISIATTADTPRSWWFFKPALEN